jgi:hypothetical protein
MVWKEDKRTENETHFIPLISTSQIPDWTKFLFIVKTILLSVFVLSIRLKIAFNDPDKMNIDIIPGDA